jgi:hypothetical protein
MTLPYRLFLMCALLIFGATPVLAAEVVCDSGHACMPALRQAAATVPVLRLAATTSAGVTGPVMTGSWTNPTQYTDGSTLAASAITQTRIQYGTCASITPSVTMGTVQGQAIAAGTVTTLTFSVSSYGVYCAQMLTTAMSLDTPPVPRESAPSLAATVTLIAPPPAPPSGPQLQQSVTVTTIAYVPVLGNNRLTFLIVGKVPLGIPCDLTQPDGPFFVIPRSTVSYDGPTRPTTVVGACGPAASGQTS